MCSIVIWKCHPQNQNGIWREQNERKGICRGGWQQRHWLGYFTSSQSIESAGDCNFTIGDGRGPINNIAFPSRVSPAYAPAGKSLASVVVLGSPDENDALLVQCVQDQLADWFGPEVHSWRHLKTYRIPHALPDQSPPTSSPVSQVDRIRSGVFVCGEHGSLPGIQWALLSGRRTADAVQTHLRGRSI